jgi:AcrR family transcriptional regulator
MQGLRERKNERTRAAITRAALELALEVGFERATVAQIAERADVSPRTVHTWFPSKDDIVLGGSDLAIDRLAGELADGEGDTFDRISAWIKLEGSLQTESEDLMRLRHRVLRADPHLQSLQRGRQQGLEDLIAAAIAEEAGLPTDAIGARALASAVLTTLLTMQRRFAEEETHSDDAGFDAVVPMLRAALAALRDA